jgi:hypothetical protein
MRLHRRFALLAVFCSALTPAAYGALQSGDVIIVGAVGGHQTIGGYVEGVRGVYIYRGGALAGHFDTDHAAGSVIAGPDGHLYLGGCTCVAEFDSDGTFVSTFGPDPNVSGEFVFDQAANLYVGDVFASTARKFTAAHLPAGVHQLPAGARSVDLARDQCTLFYTQPVIRAIGRRNVCQNTALSDIPTPLAAQTPQEGLRILPNGDLLIANSADGIAILDPSGHLHHVIPVPAGLIALAPGGREVWVAKAQTVKVDIATGAILASIDASRFSSITGIAVVGEPRAALAPAPVPAISAILVALLATILVAAALLRLR